MNEMNHIDHLLDKYWAGTSSLDEEIIIREHYDNDEQSLSPGKAIFDFFKEERRLTTERAFTTPQAKTFQLKRYVFSIAASLVLLISAFWAVNNFDQPTSNDFVVNDPQVALQITKEAFALIGGNVNKSEKALRDNIVHLDKTLIFKNL